MTSAIWSDPQLIGWRIGTLNLNDHGNFKGVDSKGFLDSADC